MDNRPIGFFDSGLGGLTSIPYLVDRMPEEKIIYFGDTARTPYGSKATSTIQKFSVQIADFLVKHDVKMIVIACNTVSATCLEMLQKKYPAVPVLGIIQPAAQKIINTRGTDNHIGVIGTKVTINSHAYSDIIKTFNPGLNVFEKATPAFVPLIEEGIITSDIMDLTIKYYLDDFVLENRLDTLVLGCTHYPLIRENIKRLYPELKIIDPSEEVAGNIKYVLDEKNMAAEKSNVTNTFYASDLSENFRNMIDRIFSDTDVKVKFKNLDMEI
ncbi:MAG: glutamate racemase [Eubacteriaceae bacterium]|nr:glutamate racemase [Eubacteriaceae bacterium]